MTQTHGTPAVIARLVAEHIEEQAVHVVSLETFRQDLHGLLAIVAAVDAGRVEAVVNHRLPVGLAEEPLRVRVEDGLLRLAQIVSPDHPDAPGVRLPQDVAEQVSPGGKIGTRVVERRRVG